MSLLRYMRKINSNKILYSCMQYIKTFPRKLESRGISDTPNKKEKIYLLFFRKKI